MNLKNKAKDIPNKMGSCLKLSNQETLQLYKILYKILG